MYVVCYVCMLYVCMCTFCVSVNVNIGLYACTYFCFFVHLCVYACYR